MGLARLVNTDYLPPVMPRPRDVAACGPTSHPEAAVDDRGCVRLADACCARLTAWPVAPTRIFAARRAAFRYGLMDYGLVAPNLNPTRVNGQRNLNARGHAAES
jgi:hypothetical protein